MERGFNAGQTHSSIIIPIYFQQFTSYSEILVGNCNFSYPLHLTSLLGVFPLECVLDYRLRRHSNFGYLTRAVATGLL